MGSFYRIFNYFTYVFSLQDIYRAWSLRKKDFTFELHCQTVRCMDCSHGMTTTHITVRPTTTGKRPKAEGKYSHAISNENNSDDQNDDDCNNRSFHILFLYHLKIEYMYVM